MLHTCVSTKGWWFCWFIDNTVIPSSLFARHCTRCWLQWKSKLGSCPHSAESLEKWLDTELVSKSEGTDGGKCWEGKTDWNDRKPKADLLRGGVRGSPSKEWAGASLTEWRNEPLSCPSREVVFPLQHLLPTSKALNTWTIYRQGQYWAPPPMLIPIRFWASFCRVTFPGTVGIPLERRARAIEFPGRRMTGGDGDGDRLSKTPKSLLALHMLQRETLSHLAKRAAFCHFVLEHRRALGSMLTGESNPKLAIYQWWVLDKQVTLSASQFPHS